jgi:hypothetical protein
MTCKILKLTKKKLENNKAKGFFFLVKDPFQYIEKDQSVKCPGLQRIPNKPNQRHSG